MRLLLDTHIWIWSELEPHRLKAKLFQTLRDPDNERYLSPVSIWEAAILLEKGRIQIQEPFEVWLDKSVRSLLLQEAPFTWEVACQAKSVALSHRDPADRLLAATAQTHRFTLVTADQRLLNVPDLEVLPNA